MQEELSTYADEVFESASEAAMKEEEPSSKNDETELTGSALDKTELERSHLLLYELTNQAPLIPFPLLDSYTHRYRKYSFETCHY